MLAKISPVFLLLLSLLTLTQCKKDEIETVEDFDEYLASEMERQKIPALAALIFKENEILHEAYLGESNVEQSATLNANGVFLLASVSKLITGTALLQLHEQGRFGLDEPINDYLPFAVSVPNYSEQITFRMLLTHTSGIADGAALDGQYYYGQDSPVALGDFLQNYLSTSGNLYDASDNFHDFAPGTQAEYSNIGSALIALLVEEISQTDFNTYCKNNIFTPLGMSQTFWRLDEATQSGLPLVMPYNSTASGFEAIGHYTFTDYPNGGLRTTARDMQRFLSALAQNGRAGNGFQLLQSATVAAMLTPQIPDLDADAGLHTFRMNTEHNLWGHDGGEQGVATIVAFNPSTKIGIVLFANEGEANLDAMLTEAYELSLKL